MREEAVGSLTQLARALHVHLLVIGYSGTTMDPFLPYKRGALMLRFSFLLSLLQDHLLFPIAVQSFCPQSWPSHGASIWRCIHVSFSSSPRLIPLSMCRSTSFLTLGPHLRFSFQPFTRLQNSLLTQSLICPISRSSEKGATFSLVQSTSSFMVVRWSLKKVCSRKFAS